MEVVDKLERTWDDISSEHWRCYTFRGAAGEYYIIQIDNPVALNVSLGIPAIGGASHRILTQDGVSHYIPRGWLELRWKAKPDQPHFVK